MSAAIDRPALRKLLEAVLLSGADFDAFCMDYHPDVYRRLDGTGDLRIKQNLLLLLLEPDELLASLRRAHPKIVERLWNNDETLRERRNRELADRLEQLLKERTIVLSWTEDSRRIDAEIQQARTALRHGPSLHAGEVLSDKYQLARQLGTGTFAEVWQSKVLGAADGQTVALKVLHGRWCKDEAFVHRFGIGAKILAQLSHPHIVKLIEPATESQGFHYLAMEYLAGGDLYQAVLNDKSGQHRERWIRAVLDVGRALNYAYGKIPKLVHRDVKPHNILLDEQGRGKLCDFDLVLDPTAVRGTQTAQGLGTPDFAAPEQTRNAAAVDQRADVYGLAQTVLFVLNSQIFIEERDPQKPILDQIEMTSAVREVLRRATEYFPAKRTSTVVEFCAALESALQVKESPAVVAPSVSVKQVETEPPASPVLLPDIQLDTSKPGPAALRRQWGRNRWLGAVVATAVLGTSGITIWRKRNPHAGSSATGSGSVPTVMPDLARPVDLASRIDLAEAPDLSASNQRNVPVATSNQAPPVEPPKQTEPTPPPPPAKIPGMIWIPEGAFMMGSNSGDSDEKPVHEEKLPGFYLDQTEVTMAQYQACAKAGGCTELAKTVQWDQGDADWVKKWSPFCNVNQSDDRSQHPVNCVDWNQAAAYCKFKGKRLPTEKEWEYAARGKDGRKYPWGNEAPRSGLLNACGSECVEMLKRKGLGTFSPMYSGNDTFETTAPVGIVQGDKSPFGVMDLGGNVTEWVQDWYRGSYRKSDGPTKNRSFRGGSWNDFDPSYARAPDRSRNSPMNRHDDVGFRCARTK